jgi:hypothetical protein
MFAKHSLKNRFLSFGIALGLAVGGVVGLSTERSSAASRSCWSILSGGISYCRGQVGFDVGGRFAGATNERRFKQWAVSGKPQTFELNSFSTGLLRWRGKGDCLYTHGASGNWLLWCGTRAAILQLVDETDGEWDGEPWELMCKVKRGVEVMDVTPRGVAYATETCALIGGKPQ